MNAICSPAAHRCTSTASRPPTSAHWATRACFTESNDTATARRLSVTLAFTTQFIKAARDGDTLKIFGAWRPSTSQSTFAAETEIYDQKDDLIATGTGTFRYLKGERSDGMLAFLDQKAAD